MQSKIHDLSAPKKSSSTPFMAVIVVVLTLALGTATGFFASRVFGSKTGASGVTKVTDAEVTADGTPKTAGIKDPEQFKDTAEGTLKEGGFEGEGSFHLERPGGESQNVYLTSSTVDLSLFVGKKVSVLGKTFDSEKAGWLMDVGYIELK
jgi:hypothetical protein